MKKLIGILMLALLANSAWTSTVHVNLYKNIFEEINEDSYDFEIMSIYTRKMDSVIEVTERPNCDDSESVRGCTVRKVLKSENVVQVTVEWYSPRDSEFIDVKVNFHPSEFKAEDVRRIAKYSKMSLNPFTNASNVKKSARLANRLLNLKVTDYTENLNVMDPYKSEICDVEYRRCEDKYVYVREDVNFKKVALTVK